MFRMMVAFFVLVGTMFVVSAEAHSPRLRFRMYTPVVVVGEAECTQETAASCAEQGVQTACVRQARIRPVRNMIQRIRQRRAARAQFRAARRQSRVGLRSVFLLGGCR